ncbi:MFS transporter [Jiulongibacter sediminis]|uniref:Major facilitator transporter n=1 Tax=Jiulongibacter sediminis TaxID=1605367 RepID=A0A0P7BZ15_9BACT|nr:MFS transporter [Jiulongibacter sediminis]KPM49761.1 major facilitator transporter [Jiulongibacter sediminis]TBX26797.1 major facilitator transporter [Jiulongibacter sediminis]
MKKVDIQPLLDNAVLSSFHKKILFWTAFIIVFDGYDLVIYGSVLPVLMKEWDLSPVTAGSLASYALFGMMLGAFFFGSFGNRIGSKKAIILCILIFSVFTFLCGFTNSVEMFGAFRFLAGLGIGGVMPNAVSLMAEYAPKKIRNTLITTMFSGIAIGGILSVLVGMFLIEGFGWQAVFFFGIIPVLLLPFMIRDIPESMHFLSKKGLQERMKSILSKIAPNQSFETDSVLEIHTAETEKANLTELFKNNRLLSTLMFWVAFFCCLLVIYGINSWLPKLIMAKPEYQDNLSLSLTFLLVFNIGAVVGAILGGRLGDKYDIKKVVIGFFVLAALSIALLGYTSSALLYILMFIAGATTSGNQIVLNTLVAQYYPHTLRATGFGWALGIGRLGAIIGPSLVGFLVALQLPFEQNFFAFAVAAAIAAVAIFFVNYKKD